MLMDRHYYKASDVELSNGCDTSCRTSLLCSIVTTNYWDQSRCEKIKKINAFPNFTW